MSENELTDKELTAFSNKIQHFCNYRERCRKEVMEKLQKLGLNEVQAQKLRQSLEKSGLLDENRFAKAFAGGKFRQKRWGKTRILRELKARKIGDSDIREAMLEIADEDYRKTLTVLAEKYIASLKKSGKTDIRHRTIRYLISKGYEYEECQSTLRHSSSFKEF